MNFKIWLLRRIFKYTSPFFSIFDNYKIKQYSNKKSELSPVFIVGVPRSGSTILYQLITNFFNVSYISNLVCLARENLFFGFWLNHLLYRNKEHNSFVSDQGRTIQTGLIAPSEGGAIWYRWFNKKIVYFNTDDLRDGQKQTLKYTLDAIINKYKKPLVIKNLMFTQRLRIIAELFPKSKIIYVKRDPVFNAQSILIARSKFPQHEWWSVKPRNYRKIQKEPLVRQAVYQTYFLQKQIETDLRQFQDENVLVINYEDITKNYLTAMQKLETFLGIPLKLNYQDHKINSKNSIKIDKKLFDELVKETSNFNW